MVKQADHNSAGGYSDEVSSVFLVGSLHGCSELHADEARWRSLEGDSRQMITLSSKGITFTDPLLKHERRAPRVAYFAGTMRPDHDGVTRVLYRLISYLNERKIDNVFFSPILGEGEHPTSMHVVPSVAFPLYKDYRLAIPGYKHFEEQLRRFKPDLLHINSPCSLGYAAVKYAHKAKIPVVATYHTHFASYAKYYNISAFENLSWNYFRKIYNGCQRVYVPSQPILRELKEHGLRNLEFLPHGVDTQTFDPKFRSNAWRRNLGIDDKIILLFVGRLVWEKDLRTLAEAYQILSRQRNDLAFVLVGDGPIRTQLQALMPEAIFLGHQSGEQLSRAYASSDVFVFPSTTETFGNVTIEAMASGVAPICALEGGSGGLVKNGSTGLLFRAHSGHALASMINHLADAPSLREEIARQALTFARSQSWEHIFDCLLECYDRVIDEYALDLLCNGREAA